MKNKKEGNFKFVVFFNSIFEKNIAILRFCHFLRPIITVIFFKHEPKNIM